MTALTSDAYMESLSNVSYKSHHRILWNSDDISTDGLL